jgi:hypothetical protein
LRRGSPLLLMCTCSLGLLFGTSYLSQSPAPGSTAQTSGVSRQASRLVETREHLSGTFQDRAREIAYGLEHAKDELSGLLP